MTESDQQMKAPLGVALGGGGMKGWAHVGVISVLDRLGLQPAVIAGTSSGAIIGAYYASGFSVEEMIDLMRAQKTASLFKLRWDRQGLWSRRYFRDYLAEQLANASFEDLPIPFFVICTDLETGREVVVNQGPVVDAVMASSAVPGVFAPEHVHERWLVDGGMTNNVPVSALINHGARYTIGVRLRRGEQPPLRNRKASPSEGMGLSGWSERLSRRFQSPAGPTISVFEVIERAMGITVSQLESYRLLANPPDVLIMPDVSEFRTFGFSVEKEEIFNRGVAAAEDQMEALARLAKRLAA